MEEAIRSATKALPGKAAEADLGKDEGRTIWKIEVIDQNNKSQTVYVDAQTGVARLNTSVNERPPAPYGRSCACF
ncbi:MAG TPA: PepSY domain-containing protein [Nitrospira sp.]|nr:PepSY domain-containing protein [Nitrospira sp.]